MLQQISTASREERWNDNNVDLNTQKLRVVTTACIHYINVSDIIRIQSISNYSKLVLKNGKTVTVAKALAHFDEELAGSHFSRIHRTHLVNLYYLKNYLRGDMNRVSLSNNEVLPVSRRKNKMLQEKMKFFC